MRCIIVLQDSVHHQITFQIVKPSEKGPYVDNFHDNIASTGPVYKVLKGPSSKHSKGMFISTFINESCLKEVMWALSDILEEMPVNILVFL